MPDEGENEVRAELRAHRSALNAPGQTQSETMRELREFKTEMRKFQVEVRQSFGRLEAGMSGIVTILNRLAPEN